MLVTDDQPTGSGDADATTVLALDIGGTKLAAASITGSGRILSEGRRATAGHDGEDLFATVAGLMHEVVDRSNRVPDAVGVGCGGPMEQGGDSVSPLNIPQWRGFPLRSRLAGEFGVAVRVDNDAKALARAEGWLGAAQGCRDFVAMVVSTGVGGGIVLDGRVLDGALGNAGHIGHVIVDPTGRQCVCGARGCLEAQVSGRSIEESTGRPAVEADLETKRWAGRLVGRAVASVANLLDLRLAVVAGSVALGFGEPFFTAAQDELDRSACLDYSRGTRIVPSGCGEHGPLLGAAAVGLEELGR